MNTSIFKCNPNENIENMHNIQIAQIQIRSHENYAAAGILHSTHYNSAEAIIFLHVQRGSESRTKKKKQKINKSNNIFVRKNFAI